MSYPERIGSDAWCMFNTTCWLTCQLHLGTRRAEDLSAIFKVICQKTALALAEEFVELYGKHFPKAISVFEAGTDDALTYLSYPSYPGSHHARIRTTNMLERHFEEVKRRTRVVLVFPNERMRLLWRRS